MKKYIDLGKKDMCLGFGVGFIEFGKFYFNVVVFCVDLIGFLKMDDFKVNYLE